MYKDVDNFIDDLFHGESYETMKLFVKKLVIETYNKAIDDCFDALGEIDPKSDAEENILIQVGNIILEMDIEVNQHD